jgi:hypothetical protein
VGEILMRLHEKGLNIIDFLETFAKTSITGTMVLSDPKIRESLKNLNTDLLKQTSDTKNIAEVMRSALIPSLQNLLNNLNAVGISLFESMGSGATDIIKNMTNHFKDLDLWVRVNKKSIDQAASTVFALTNTFSELISLGLKVAVSNFGLLTNAVLILLGVKVLGGLTPMFSNIIKSTKSLDTAFLSVPTWSKSWTNWLNVVSSSTMIFTVAYAAINTIIDKINTKLDQQMTNALDMSREGTEKRVSAIDKVINAYMTLENYKKNHNKSGASYEGALELHTIKELTDSLNSAKKSYTNEGYYKGEISSLEMATKTAKNYRRELSDLDEKQKEINTTQSSIKLEGTKVPEKEKSTQENKDISKLGVLGLLGEENDDALSNAIETTSTIEEAILKIRADAIEKYVSDFMEADAKKIELDKEELERKKKLAEEEEALNKKSTQVIYDSYWSLGNSTSSILSTINAKNLENTEKTLTAEKDAVLARYDSEIESASTNTFKKEMLEQRRTNAETKANAAIEKAKKESNRRQRISDNLKASADTVRAIIGTIADTQGGPISRAASGISIGAITGAYLAELVSINYRNGSKGLITGDGNTTSDSIIAKVSKGERLLSSAEIDSLGGNESIQQSIDKGTTYSSNKNMTFNISTVLGTRQFVRDELIPVLQKEIRR